MGSSLRMPAASLLSAEPANHREPSNDEHDEDEVGEHIDCSGHHGGPGAASAAGVAALPSEKPEILEAVGYGGGERAPAARMESNPRSLLDGQLHLYFHHSPLTPRRNCNYHRDALAIITNAPAAAEPWQPTSSGKRADGQLLFAFERNVHPALRRAAPQSDGSDGRTDNT